MMELNKRIWVAKLLALVIMSLMALLSSFLFHSAFEKMRRFENKITIGVDGDIGDIITSVEALDRKDIEIITQKVWVFGHWGGHMDVIGTIFMLVLIFSIYHIIYGAFLALMPIKREDKLTDSYKIEQ